MDFGAQSRRPSYVSSRRESLTDSTDPTAPRQSIRNRLSRDEFSRMDSSSTTGNTNLSGEAKDAVPHYRADDKQAGLEQRYEIGRKVGQGAFGTVRLIVDKETGRTWACKSIEKRRGKATLLEQLAREVSIMKRVQHKHIVSLREVHETPRRIYMVMEYCEGGELVKSVKRRSSPLTEDDTRLIITRLVETVAYLHDHGVVHRDLKPENVLLSTENKEDPFNIRVSDFGLATLEGAGNEMLDNTCGTPFYMAPEIRSGLDYSHQCDIWSIGVMFYLLLCAYTRAAEQSLLQQITNKSIDFTADTLTTVSPTAVDLLKRMLTFDPAERISAHEILEHPWISGQVLDATGSMSSGPTTVLQMMKQYAAERRLRKGMTAVQAAIRFSRPNS